MPYSLLFFTKLKGDMCSFRAARNGLLQPEIPVVVLPILKYLNCGFDHFLFLRSGIVGLWIWVEDSRPVGLRIVGQHKLRLRIVERG